MCSKEGFGPGVYHKSKGKGLSVALVTINTCVGASAPRHTMILSGSSYEYGCVAAGGYSISLPSLST